MAKKQNFMPTLEEFTERLRTILSDESLYSREEGLDMPFLDIEGLKEFINGSLRLREVSWFLYSEKKKPVLWGPRDTSLTAEDVRSSKEDLVITWMPGKGHTWETIKKIEDHTDYLRALMPKLQFPLEMRDLGEEI